MDSIWKDAKGFPGYKVSSNGEVCSYKRTKSKIMKPKVAKTFAGVPSRLELSMIDSEGKRKNVAIARLVAIAFIPNPDDLPEVHHKDKDIFNNSVTNLFWSNKTNR